MRSDPTPEPGDMDRRPFSNGTEGEMWLWNVCGAGGGCIHDSDHGSAPEAETWCPLITLSLSGVWPHEWAVEEVPFTSVDGMEMHYTRPGDCSEFTDEPPVVLPDPVVAVDLFGTYSAEPEVAS